MVARFKALICSRSPAGIAGSNPAGGMDVYLLWVSWVVRYTSLGSGRLLIGRNPTECDCEASMRPRTTLNCCTTDKNIFLWVVTEANRNIIQDSQSSSWDSKRGHLKEERWTPNTTPRRPSILRHAVCIRQTGIYRVPYWNNDVTFNIARLWKMRNIFRFQWSNPMCSFLGHATFYCVLPRYIKTKFKRWSREGKRPVNLMQCQKFRFIFESHAQWTALINSWKFYIICGTAQIYNSRNLLNSTYTAV